MNALLPMQKNTYIVFITLNSIDKQNNLKILSLWILLSFSKLMNFNISHENLSVKLCGKEVLLVSHETYLANFIGSDIFDRAITQSVCAFNQSNNHLIADFSMIDSFLHSNYCMSL